MKKLWTHCPNCRLGFYVDLEGKDEKIDVTCPNCSFNYGETVDEDRIKEVEYNWELNDQLHTGLIFEDYNVFHLKFAGAALTSALVLFFIGGLSILLSDDFTMIHHAVGLAGVIFGLVVFLGTMNAYQRKSFAVAFTGSFFSVLSSALWSYLSTVGDFVFFVQELSILYPILTFFLSLLALTLIVQKRHTFKLGY